MNNDTIDTGSPLDASSSSSQCQVEFVIPSEKKKNTTKKVRRERYQYERLQLLLELTLNRSRSGRIGSRFCSTGIIDGYMCSSTFRCFLLLTLGRTASYVGIVPSGRFLIDLLKV